MRIQALAVLALLAAVPAHAQSINDLSWLSGCWIEEKGDRIVEENWTTPSGGVMLSTGRTVKAGQLRDYEFARIQMKDGRLVFTAMPVDQAEASFTALTTDGQSVDFANPTHDFPQHVRYRLSDPDSLHAEIEGPMGGQSKIISWEYRRCTP